MFHLQTDLGEAVTAGPLFVQIVLQQALTHIFHNLDESEISAETQRSRTHFCQIHNVHSLT